MDNVSISDLKEIFPIKILASHDSNFNDYRDDLISWMEEYSRNNQSTSKSNVGGYQSPDNFHFDKDSGEVREDFKPYYFRIQKQIEKMTEVYFEDSDVTSISFSNIWFNFNFKNCYNNIHVHPRSALSGVLWVKVIEEHPPITFHDPNQFNQVELGFKTFEAFYPKDGDMLIFPAFLQHGVNVNRTDVTRMSIAFNLTTNADSYD